MATYAIKRFAKVTSQEDIEKEKKDSEGKKGSSRASVLGTLVGGTGLITGASTLNKKTRELMKESSSKESKDALANGLGLYNKVKDESNSRGIVATMNPEMFRDEKTHYESPRSVRKSYHKILKDAKSHPEYSKKSIDELNELISSDTRAGGKQLFEAYKNGKGKIGINEEDVGRPSAIAHELGHAIDQTEGGVGSKIRNTIDIVDKGSSSTSAVTGLLSGINSERLSRKGKKEGLISKHSSWAVPVLMNTPTLINEAVASRKGYKVLKDVGATKDQLKNARNTMIGACGSYASKTIGDVGVGLVSRGVGKLAGKSYYKLKDHKRSKKDKNPQ